MDHYTQNNILTEVLNQCIETLSSRIQHNVFIFLLLHSLLVHVQTPDSNVHQEFASMSLRSVTTRLTAVKELMNRTVFSRVTPGIVIVIT